MLGDTKFVSKYKLLEKIVSDFPIYFFSHNNFIKLGYLWKSLTKRILTAMFFILVENLSIYFGPQ